MGATWGVSARLSEVLVVPIDPVLGLRGRYLLYICTLLATIQLRKYNLNFKVVKAVVVASPGFVKDQFLEYLKQYSIKNDVKGT